MIFERRNNYAALLLRSRQTFQLSIGYRLSRPEVYTFFPKFSPQLTDNILKIGAVHSLHFIFWCWSETLIIQFTFIKNFKKVVNDFRWSTTLDIDLSEITYFWVAVQHKYKCAIAYSSSTYTWHVRRDYFRDPHDILWNRSYYYCKLLLKIEAYHYSTMTILHKKSLEKNS